MDIDALVTIISSLGVPVALCVFFCWRDVKYMDKQETLMNKIDGTLEIIKKYISDGKDDCK
ncbi:MAG: hypothetical protein MJ197_09745 [Bacteroidales bacterium]|nr:hypothetical protein [Bacteroidales bacterium]